jgi:hypothetical protein
MAQTLHEVYRRALNADPGRSPYGRLQFELGKLKAQSAQRLDMVELLAALSRLAPEGVRIREVSMATASGVATGSAATPEDLRRYQADPGGRGLFDISLAKADMLARQCVSSWRSRRATAPPRRGRTSELPNGPWRAVARLAHLPAAAQRRLWRTILCGWALALLGAWAGLSAFTRMEEKQVDELGQTYMSVAPLAAEVMDLRQRRGQLEGQPPLLAAERVARSAGIGPERLALTPVQQPDGVQRLSLRAQALTLPELVGLLRDLNVEAGLGTVSAHMAPTPEMDDRMDLDLVLAR